MTINGSIGGEEEEVKAHYHGHSPSMTYPSPTLHLEGRHPSLHSEEEEEEEEEGEDLKGRLDGEVSML
ncbi:hypothetical protein SAY86_021729 [Trapa natans]|uniref:Uncharacterized protein n=1 Tax=Trapa natans TaxID=22666 RepID=A0AAN7RF01_TRANT|nr:hypothetical protein SAY86_021729 [Trapa natans]